MTQRLEWIIEDLAKSLLTPENFTVEPLRSEQELRERLGFTHLGTTRIINVGGFWIPYPNVPGYYRLKIKEKIGDAKYLSPQGRGNHAYILPSVAEIVKNYNPDKPIFITEGEKKAAKATLEGFPCIGLCGVWSFKDSETVFLQELDELIWADRTVYITFDSDITQKHNIKHAELRLAVELMNRGAIAYSIRLPNEPNGDKNGLDDFLVRYGVEKFRELIQDPRPTLELHISSDIRTERILEEIARLKSESEKDKWVKLLSDKRGIHRRALAQDLKRNKPLEESKPEEKKYTAYFPKLVDLVEDENGNVVFLVKEDDGLAVKANVITDGEIYCPPPLEENSRKLFKFIPRANEVLRHYTQDTDQKLFRDLISYLNLVSELPDNELYSLIAAWVLHTYLLEAFEYSPYIWLFAIPERGKSRTGKGTIYVAYRGVHLESVKDAQLIRFANDLKATLFIDAIDLWKKAEKAGSEDFFLQRHERGAFIARVLFPERGAFKDTRYFEIFGATFIATNEGIHPALESRAVLIIMKEALKEFGDIPLDLAQSLKERLVAFRARHLGKELLQLDKPAKGRLGDILKPLMQMVILVDPDRETEFRELIAELDRDRKAQKSDSTEAKLISIIAELESQVNDGLLSIQVILSRYNEGIADKYKTTNQRLGWRLKALGFNKRRRNEGTYLEFDGELLERLRIQFGLKEVSNISTGTPLEHLHHLHHLHSTNNDKGFSDEDIGVDVGQTEKSSLNLHLQNPHKYGLSVNGEDGVDVSNGIEEKNNFSDYEIEKITYATGDVVYQVAKVEEDGKRIFHIITPDLLEFEDVQREYEQRSR